MNENIYFISEVSSNHSRDFDRCVQFIETSKKINCNAVKFQLFKINELFSPEAFIAKPFLRNRSNWELPKEYIKDLKSCALSNNIDFSCTPFFLDAVDILEPYVDFFKIASYELLWDDLLIECAKTKKPIILSTGMANVEEIDHAVEIIKTNGCANLSLLHCSSAYPTKRNESNLASIKFLSDRYRLPIGWSDHTVDQNILNRAIYKWNAEIIEFHLDIDGSGDEFATGHCWLPSEIGDLISFVKDIKLIDGKYEKVPNKSELEERKWRADPSDGLRPIKKIRNNLL